MRVVNYENLAAPHPIHQRATIPVDNIDKITNSNNKKKINDFNQVNLVNIKVDFIYPHLQKRIHFWCHKSKENRNKLV